MSAPSGYKVPEVDLTYFDEKLFCSCCGFASKLVMQTGLCEHLYCEKCLGEVLRKTNPVCVKCETLLHHPLDQPSEKSTQHARGHGKKGKERKSPAAELRHFVDTVHQ